MNLIKLEYKDDPDVLPEDYEEAADEFVHMRQIRNR